MSNIKIWAARVLNLKYERDAAHSRIAALEAENAKLKEAAVDAASSLAAAISLLERTPSAMRVAPSNKMFIQMMDDYRAALERTRAAIA